MSKHTRDTTTDIPESPGRVPEPSDAAPTTLAELAAYPTTLAELAAYRETLPPRTRRQRRVGRLAVCILRAALEQTRAMAERYDDRERKETQQTEKQIKEFL